MKSKLFIDTQGLDIPFTDNAPDKLSVCLRLSRSSYIHIARQADLLGMTTGEYVDGLIFADKQQEAGREKPVEKMLL